jgi:hypothetical protein
MGREVVAMSGAFWISVVAIVLAEGLILGLWLGVVR